MSGLVATGRDCGSETGGAPSGGWEPSTKCDANGGLADAAGDRRLTIRVRSPGRLAARVQGRACPCSLAACRAQGRATDWRLGEWTVRPPARPVGRGCRHRVARPHAPRDVSHRPAPGGCTAVADYRTRAKRVFDSPHQFVGSQEPRRTIGQLCCSIALRGTQCASEGQIMIRPSTGSARPTSARWRQQQKQTTTYSVAAGICASENPTHLKCRVNSSTFYGYGVWIQ